MINRLRLVYRNHHNFILLLLLFVAFRALTLLAFRPGGQVLDFSDYYWYRQFAQMIRQGYFPYDNLWTTYPPLFPLLMIGVWKISALLPPWEFSDLWFSLLIGNTFLLFETGNFILLYLMALKIYPSEKALKPAWIYALLFAPVYTLTGWFESYPLFFFLLGLYLLLQNRPYLSAFFGGVGFMVKLFPILLLPIGAKLLPVQSKWRLRIPFLNVDFDLLNLGKYFLVFIGTIVIIAVPFYRLNPDLILTPFALTGSRLPWETIWALLEGNFAYGIIELDMRNLALASVENAPSSLPWGVISLIFAAFYAFLYTRRIDWQRASVAIAFAGLTVCVFFLYSKGYSPQWIVWPLFFCALLLPNMRGVIYAVILSAANIIEANIFFTIFPDEHWLLAGTVIVRTVLLAILIAEFCLIIWPKLASSRVTNARRWIVAIGLAILLLLLIPAATRLYPAYFEYRLAQSPYKASIQWLDEQSVKEAILLNDHTTYDWLYPYLRDDHRFYMLDDYVSPDTTIEAKMDVLLSQIASENKAVWLFDTDPAQTSPAEVATIDWLGTAQLAHQADIDGGRLYLFIFSQGE